MTLILEEYAKNSKRCKSNLNRKRKLSKRKIERLRRRINDEELLINLLNLSLIC
jgi:hypothetical protein